MAQFQSHKEGSEMPRYFIFYYAAGAFALGPTWVSIYLLRNAPIARISVDALAIGVALICMGIFLTLKGSQ